MHQVKEKSPNRFLEDLQSVDLSNKAIKFQFCCIFMRFTPDLVKSDYYRSPPCTWHGEIKGGTFTFLAFHPDATLVMVHNFLDNGKSDTRGSIVIF